MKNGASTVCRHCGRCWGWHGPCHRQEKLVEGERRETSRQAGFCNPVQTLQRHNQRGWWGHRGGPYPTLGSQAASKVISALRPQRQGRVSLVKGTQSTENVPGRGKTMCKGPDTRESMIHGCQYTCPWTNEKLFQWPAHPRSCVPSNVPFTQFTS